MQTATVVIVSPLAQVQTFAVTPETMAQVFEILQETARGLRRGPQMGATLAGEDYPAPPAIVPAPLPDTVAETRADGEIVMYSPSEQAAPEAEKAPEPVAAPEPVPASDFMANLAQLMAEHA